jgi:hypothetical protein
VYARNDTQWEERDDFNTEEKNEKKDKQRNSFDLIDYGARSKSVMAKKKRPNSGSFIRDAKDYYRDYDDNSRKFSINKEKNRESAQLLTDDLVGECYVGFSKLM